MTGNGPVTSNGPALVPGPDDCDALIAEAQAAQCIGWDFSWLNSRSSESSLPWSFADEIAAHTGYASTMLDMGTGGGEFLSGFASRPPRTVATESWPPNVPVAAARLRPADIPVLHAEGAPDNMSDEAAADQAAPVPGSGRLPFADGSLDLVINRHEAFSAREVGRVLAPGGRFVTQQVDFGSDMELYELLGLEPPPRPESWLPLAVAQLSAAGLDVTVQQAGRAVRHLRDVGALVYYLRIVPWAIPPYRLEELLPRMRGVATTPGAWPAAVSVCRFLVVARRPLA